MSDTSQPMPFETSVSSASATTLLRLAGELDLATVPTFVAILDQGLPDAAPHVVFDLAGLHFVDVAGARALTRAVARTRSTGRTAIVVSPTRPVERVLCLLGVAGELGLGSGARSPAPQPQLSRA